MQPALKHRWKCFRVQKDSRPIPDWQ